MKQILFSFLRIAGSVSFHNHRSVWWGDLCGWLQQLSECFWRFVFLVSPFLNITRKMITSPLLTLIRQKLDFALQKHIKSLQNDSTPHDSPSANRFSVTLILLLFVGWHPLSCSVFTPRHTEDGWLIIDFVLIVLCSAWIIFYSWKIIAKHGTCGCFKAALYCLSSPWNKCNAMPVLMLLLLLQTIGHNFFLRPCLLHWKRLNDWSQGYGNFSRQLCACLET